MNDRQPLTNGLLVTDNVATPCPFHPHTLASSHQQAPTTHITRIAILFPHTPVPTNPSMNKVETIRKLNESELELGIAGTSASWHEKYIHCSAIYVGGLHLQLTEGDLLEIFEQYGIVIHINLVRDNETGKSRGFAFLKYHDPRSSILAIDNFNGIEIAGRTLHVDHDENYTVPEEGRVGTFDTTPEHLKLDTSTGQMPTAAALGHTPPGEGDNRVETQSADVIRGQKVQERLRAMRRRTNEDHGIAPQEPTQTSQTPSDSKQHNSPAAEESEEQSLTAGQSMNGAEGFAEAVAQMNKQRRREERAKRKAERARIREERRKRREDRENPSLDQSPR